MDYERFERHIDPSTQNEALIERDLFGSAAVPERGDARDALDAYGAELRREFPKLRGGALEPEARERLFAKGYEIVEAVAGTAEGMRPGSPVLGDIRTRVKEAFELSPREEERLQVYSAFGTPLRDVLGFDGFVKFSGKGRKEHPLYVSFEHVVSPRAVVDLADVVIPALPDRALAKGKYERALGAASNKIVQEIRRKKLARETQSQLQRRGRKPAW